MKKTALLTLATCCIGTILGAQTPPHDGLVLWLRADVGVTANAGAVTAWADQSGLNNHAGPLSGDYGPTGTEAPTLVPGAINGKAVIRFDGVDDVLEIPNSPSLQPLEGSWTVFFVAKRLSAGQGDFPQIIGSRPWLAGLDKGWAVALDSAGAVCSHLADDAAGHDAPAVRSASTLGEGFEIWQVEEDRAGGNTSFYRRGDLDRSVPVTMPVGTVDQANPIHIGREMGGANNRRANMDLAEVLIYDRALSRAERITATKYLAGLYGLPFTQNVPPTVALTKPANNATLAAPGTLAVTASASDSDGSIARVEFYNGATLLAAAIAPPYSFTLRVLSPATLSLTAVAVDDRGERVTSSPVSVTATGTGTDLSVKSGLQLWLKADAGLLPGDVTLRWEDQSGNNNHATQFDITAQPEMVANAVNGKPALRFDGQDDYMEIANSPSLQPGAGDWTVFFVGKRLPASQGDYPQVIGSRPWTLDVDKGWAVGFNTSGYVASHFADGTSGHDLPGTLAASPLSSDACQVWQVEEDRGAGTTAFFVHGSLDRSSARPMPAGPIDQTDAIEIGREIGGSDNRRANMELSEVLVYNRVLGTADRESVTAYLSAKYGLPSLTSDNASPLIALTAPADGTTVTYGSEVTLAANASDTDGAVARVEFYAGARLLGSVTNAPYSVTVADLTRGVLDLTAHAVDNLGAVAISTPVRITNLVVNPPKPMTVIGKLDYTDTFTVGPAGDPSDTNPRPDGMYNNNSFGGYKVESAYGNPEATWTPTANFSFNTPGNSTGPGITQAATGNDGATNGFAQSGGGDFSFAYGLRVDYVAQVDAILPLDRLDIGSYPNPGDNIFTARSLTIFLRKDSVAGVPGIGLFNGSKETAVTGANGKPVTTGVDDLNWHRFAVHFDQPNKRLGIYVDGVLKASVDLPTFGGGIYADFANGAVGVGGAGFNGTQAQWMDNFAVGAPSLIGVVDYSDTFTVTNAPRRDGLYNDNSAGAYNIENAYGNPPAAWTPFTSFSFNTPGSSTGPAITQAATGNDSAATGFAQSGGGDFSFAYGLRDGYVVSVDAILPLDRLDVSSLPSPGANIFATPSLTVFFRKDSATGAPGIGLFNGSKETALTDAAGAALKSGVADANWHNFGVYFDRPGSRLGVYVDGAPLAMVDLETFAGGIYKDYSNSGVGTGGAGFNGTQAQWMDNFQVGLAGSAITATAEATKPGPIAIKLGAGQVEITWPGVGTLQEATEVLGPWTPVTGAASGIKINAAVARKFYRLLN